jgi:hypothetical protein
MKTKVDKLEIEGVTYIPEDSVKAKVIELNGSESVYEIGEKYLIRTVTMIQVGRLKKVTNQELLLEDASWIADTGRFHDCLKTGDFNEVEPFTNDVIVGRGAIVDAQRIDFELPKNQK